jgi:hypothetical protein
MRVLGARETSDHRCSAGSVLELREREKQFIPLVFALQLHPYTPTTASAVLSRESESNPTQSLQQAFSTSALSPSAVLSPSFPSNSYSPRFSPLDGLKLLVQSSRPRTHLLPLPPPLFHASVVLPHSSSTPLPPHCVLPRRRIVRRGATCPSTGTRKLSWAL